MIHVFSSETVPELSKVGGKARSLIEATAAGLPVPPGFALDTDFFAPWMLRVEQSAAWATFLHASPEHSKEHCDAVKAFCSGLELDEVQRKALGRGLAAMAGDGLFAVRSSSPEEDLDGSSFAGGYETTLGVRRDELVQAIRHSFASVFDERVVQYKRQRGMSVDVPRIAVIVQTQIASDASGVAFSLNPQNNCYDEAVINSNFGLGETVVEGLVTPDTFVVDKVTGEILEQKIAEKSLCRWLQKDGGTRDANADDPKAASLSDAQAIEIAGLAGRIESHYGQPMDIEWAIARGRLYLLQARPVTTWIPLPEVMRTEPGEPKSLYLDLIVLTQGFSEPMSVLGGEYWGHMLETIKGQIMFDRGRDGTVVNAAGRQYINISNFMRALGGTRGAGRIVEVYDTPTRKIFGTIDLNEYLPKHKPAALKGVIWNMVKAYAPMIGRALRGIRNPDEARNDYAAQLERDLEETAQLAEDDLPLDEFVRSLLQRFKTQTDLGAPVLLAAMFSRWRIGRMLKGPGVDDLVVSLEMDLRGNPTSEMGHRMYELAGMPEIRRTENGAEFERKIAARAYSDEVMAAYDDYMRRFGCRGIKEIDAATPRAHENLPAFFAQLQAIDTDVDTIHTARRRRAEAHAKLLELAKAKGKGAKFERLAASQINSGYREAPKYFYVVTVDRVRRRALSAGRRFVEQRRLERAEQVFDLRIDQITRAEQNPSLALAPLIEGNLLLRQGFERVRDWPRVIDSRGKIFRAPPEDTADGLIGDPISPGVVRGRAKVLREPYEKPLEKGEILVTRASDPGWTPIFINAAGVVLEVGGPLQHGAIIAREYGLPCVSGLDGVTEQIEDGQLLEVDGSNGIVRVIAEEDGAA